MLENILVQKNVKLGTKITIKSLISVALIVCAVALPQIVHLIGGASGGMVWMPMYFPVLIAGCLLGIWWGLGVGVLSPIVSYLITSLLTNPMPALTRLPFMIVELAVFASVTGIFSKQIARNKWFAFPAVLIAQISGRAVFMALVAIFQNVSGLSVSLVWSQIQIGFVGLILQALIVPFIIVALHHLLFKEKKDE